MTASMFSATCLALVLLAVSTHGLSTTSRSAGGNHQLQTLKNSFKYSFTQMITAETNSISCTTAQDGPGQKYMQMCNTTEGWFTRWLRFDLGMSALAYGRNGVTQCFPSPLSALKGPLPAPAFNTIPFFQESLFNGKKWNVFRLPFGKYFQTVMADQVTGLPGVILPGNMDNLGSLVHDYQNGWSVDNATFELPSACAPDEWKATMANRVPESQARPARTKLPPSSVADPGNVLFRDTNHPAYRRGAAESSSTLNPAGEPWTEASLQRATEEMLAAEPFGDIQRRLPEELLRSSPPLAVDNRKYFNPARDQGLCGACYSFGSAALAEAFVNIKENRTWVTDNQHWLSPQSVIDCVVVPNPVPHDLIPKACFGGNPADALNYVAAHGIATELSYPWTGGAGNWCRLNDATVDKIFPVASAYVLPALNTTAMEAAIHTYGGILTAMNDQFSWNFYSGHFVYNETCAPGFGHIITIVGYGTDEDSGLDYWQVKNSYGGNWADGGYVKMRKGVNMCGMETYPFAAIPSK